MQYYRVPVGKKTVHLTRAPLDSNMNMRVFPTFLLLRAAAAFTSAPYYSRSFSTEPLNAGKEKCPLIIAGSTSECLGAALALCAKDELLNNRDDKSRSPVPPSQMIAFFHEPSNDERRRLLSSVTVSSIQNAIYFLGESTDNTEQMLSHALQLTSRIAEKNDGSDISPMLHTSLHFKDKSKFDALSMTRNRFSFVGLHVKTKLTPSIDDGRIILPRVDAEELGNKLQTLLDGESQSSCSAAVTMDIRSHLAMLQSNSLPRSRGVLAANSDVWAISDYIKDGIHVDNEDSILFEYNYDYSDPFGGCDPLLRAGNAYLISPSSSEYIKEANKKQVIDAFSAAYTALMGTGLDPISSICIANSVKRAFHKLGRVEGTSFHPPSYTWTNIDQIVQNSRVASERVATVNGLARKLYKEHGYR